MRKRPGEKGQTLEHKERLGWYKNKKISQGKVKSTETGLCRQKEQVAKVPAVVP